MVANNRSGKRNQVKPPQITEVEYIQSSELRELVYQVKQHLEMGFQPFGPIVVEVKYFGYIQTMVKYGEATK